MSLRLAVPRAAVVRAVERPQRSKELDGLRALAVTGVVVYHALFQLPVLWDFGYPVGLHLDVGVLVFFVLSGYLIYKPFAEANCAGREPPPLARYLLRRGARIYPAYIAALAVLALLGWIRLDGPSETIQHLTLTQSYFRSEVQLLDPPGISQAWTLVIEVSFYLFVPLWAAAMRRVPGTDRVRIEAFGAAALIVVGALALTWHAHHGLPTFLAVLPPNISGLAWGMLLAIVVAGRGSLGSRSRTPVVELCWLGAVAALGLLSFLVDEFRQTPRDRLTDQALSLVIAALLVTPIVLSAPSLGLVSRFLCWRPMVALGVVSYGIYLWHGDLIFHLPGPWSASPILPAVAGMTVRIAVSIAAGCASYYLIERTALRRVSQLR
jgi:peptidoglycan/LPS O-acetylase OafA/YrhL